MSGRNSSSHPRAVQLLNALGHRFGDDARGLISFDAETLMRRAERSTGLKDWGTQDFVPALKQLLASLDGEGRLSTMGRLMLGSGMQRFLANRLRLERDWTQEPAILQVPVSRPIFIAGFPRTGSTLLQHLLAADPAARSLRTWEMMEPSPPPTRQNFFDRRRLTARLRLAVLDWSAPEFAVAHEVQAGEPEECVTLLQNTFMTDAFDLMADLPSYQRWLIDKDMRPAYDFYQRELQVLQWRYRGERWVLKSPYHLRGLPVLLETFPDAVIIRTHRDLKEVVPSLCSLYQSMHSLISRDVDPLKQGPRRLAWLREVDAIAQDAEHQFGAHRFIDVAYRELLRDPLQTVRHIYSHCGIELTPEAEAAMRHVLETRRQHRRGSHRYTLAQFGLKDEEVDEALAGYTSRYAAYLNS